MKNWSLSRRLIATVLLVETLLALCTTGMALFYERHQHMRTFDVMLRGRADSLLGAVQDAEDEADNIMLAPKAIDLQSDDLYQVREPSGRILGQSPQWSNQLAGQFREGSHGHNFQFHDHAYRGMVLRGIRQIDQEDGKPGISRPVIIDYATPLAPVWKAVANAAKFLLLSNSCLLIVTGVAIFILLRRGMAPLQLLAAEASAISPASWEFRAPPGALAVKELAVLALALESAMRRLGSSIDQQRTFVNDAAHELKTAVTIIKSSLQLLDSRPRSLEEYRRGLESCLNDCGRLEELVQKLLTLARLEQTAGQPSSRSQTDLSESAREIVSQLDSFATLRSIALQLDLRGKLLVPLPHEECETLIFNLVLNALQHTPSGGKVTLSAAEEDGEVRMAIEDTGEGIDAADLPFVFNRFYRGDRSRARTTGGTGLGLAICKAIVDAYGGRIELLSETGKGTRAQVALPAVSDAVRLQTVFSKER
ncbi:signal transduction histidine kinase [Silvibacterium bohemicum]|uniref:histidine kinase n=1 Tax=Silvibacterium bohemicum TaxID=1577686 RepID=A0A841JX58_9BACT|nr:HAMP domain-containing sensor histidine kinase [Silvibacterium bohemicum]MBB6145145.1 signal transduction histidine kinase [Silvibacterium bohemicum]